MCEVVEISDDEDLPEFCSVRSGPVASRLVEETVGSCTSSVVLATRDFPEAVDSVPYCSATKLKKIEQETRKREREERKAAKEQEKEQKKALREEKQQEKSRTKAIKEAAKEADKATKPGERIKHMTVHLDMGFSRRPNLMENLAMQLDKLGANLQVKKNPVSDSILWYRNVVDWKIDNHDTAVVYTTSQHKEEHLLVAIAAKQLAQLVLDNGGGVDQTTCTEFVEGLRRGPERKKLTLAVVGIEAYERSKKTRQNRQFRQAVLQEEASQQHQEQPHVEGAGLEEAMVELEVCTRCCVRRCTDDTRLAELVVHMTKAIAEAPFKRKNVFSFYDDLGPGPSKKDSGTHGKLLSLIWEHQLMQFTNCGPQAASVVSSQYPTPGHLMLAYETCDNADLAALLLQDMTVQRGTTRRLGPVFSKRVHTLLTSTDATLPLN